MPTNEDMLKEIRKICDELGSQAAAAIELDISPAHLSDLLSGRRMVSDAIARQLGYERVATFNKVEE